ncbi:hypothetical protein CMI37_30370 [Candidatus Pacearchaeota archaeon]|nr:hypothetical protein [Candidatus Pacearchaeota archaeon]
MPSTLALSAYSDEHKALFMQALRGPVTVECVSHQAARRLRFQLYALRSAALIELEQAGKLGIVAPLARMRISDNALTISYERVAA